MPHQFLVMYEVVDIACLEGVALLPEVQLQDLRLCFKAWELHMDSVMESPEKGGTYSLGIVGCANQNDLVATVLQLLP